MSAVLEKLNGPQIPEALPTTELPDASVLEDRTPEWIRTTPTSALFMLLIGVVFALMANRPLWHTDLWDHPNSARQMHQRFRNGYCTSLDDLLAVVEMVPEVCMPKRSVGHQGKDDTDEQHEQG